GRCFFCYEEGRDIAKEPDMENVKRLIRETKKRADLIVLCGKEVLLRRDILEIVNYASSIGLKVAVFTNGQALSKKGLVEKLAEAGCDSIVVSFHFPDAGAFAVGARAHPKGFDLQIAGMENIRDYNLAHPQRRIGVSTETDMSVLNAGRLSEMRGTLMSAFGESPWQMRIGSLLPSKIYGIGADRILEPLALRRAELEEFVRTHPEHIPLAFVKVPLCILPEGWEHVSLDVSYVYEGTVLTFNHADADNITVDTLSTSSCRDIGRLISSHPYRWICRKCGLAPMCRFERVDWFQRFFEPSRDQKPMPFPRNKAAEIFGRLGRDHAAAARVEGVNRLLGLMKFPEEEIIESLAHPRPGAPVLTDAWAPESPVLALEFRHRGYTVPLLKSVPMRSTASQEFRALTGYLGIKPLIGAEIPRDVLDDCISAVAGAGLPDIDMWADNNWFDLKAARFLQSAWRVFGERLRAGSVFAGSWRTGSITLMDSNLLQIELEHATSARVRVVFGEKHLDSISVSIHKHDISLPATDFSAILPAVSGLLGLAYDNTREIPGGLFESGCLEARLTRGEWHFHEKKPGIEDEERTDAPESRPSGKLDIMVRDLLDGNAKYIFHVSGFQKGRPFYRREGNLVLWYSHDEMTKPAEVFSRAIMIVLKRLRTRPFSRENLPMLEALLAGVNERAGLKGRFEWTLFWSDPPNR
ncbi:MAG: radical SAM protein, partial [Deltaproteobacteria bacterium]|nr:radical SAM protein [Deltaproteobacteria bacterium]